LLELDGEGLGKPESTHVARERWRRMRGRTGTLPTVDFTISSDGRGAGACARTEVPFADVSDADIDASVAPRAPRMGACASTLDGLGGPFITRIRGDHHAVVGLSLPVLRTMLTGLGVSWPSLWNQ